MSNFDNTIKRMKCMECREEFESQHYGDDVCQPCIDKEDAENEQADGDISEASEEAGDSRDNLLDSRRTG